jgi:endonuclease III
LVDPFNIPAEMSVAYLQEWVLFGICVCNKPAGITARKVDQVLANLRMKLYEDPSLFEDPPLNPFEMIRLANSEQLDYVLRSARVGQYRRIFRAFKAAAQLNVETMTLEDLESIPGIGPKTARMTLLYSRPDLRVVPLDTHVLKYLRALGHEVPKNSPGKGKQYQRLEQAFLQEADKQGLTAKELDTKVWKTYAKVA